VALVIHGEPHAKQRPRFTKAGGIYTPKATVAYEEGVAWAGRKAGIILGDATIGVKLTFYCGKTRKLDLDNAIKSVLDGAEKGGLYDNDIQIVKIEAEVKHDKSDPRVEALFYVLPKD